MNALASTKEAGKSANLSPILGSVSAVRWVLAIFVGPVICSYWAISNNTNSILLVPTFICLLLLFFQYKNLAPPRRVRSAELIKENATTGTCAICSKSNLPTLSFSYRSVTDVNSADSLGLLSIVLQKNWRSHAKHESAFCLICGAKAVLQKALMLLFWLACIVLLAFSFDRVGFLMQAVIVLTGASVISPIRHYILCLVRPLELCRYVALGAIEKSNQEIGEKFELMSERYWGSLINGVETVESDEELVVGLQIKLVSYTLAGAVSISQLPVG